jgi:hypothetical protein
VPLYEFFLAEPFKLTLAPAELPVLKLAVPWPLRPLFLVLADTTVGCYSEIVCFLEANDLEIMTVVVVLEKPGFCNVLEGDYNSFVELEPTRGLLVFRLIVAMVLTGLLFDKEIGR